MCNVYVHDVCVHVSGACKLCHAWVGVCMYCCNAKPCKDMICIVMYACVVRIYVLYACMNARNVICVIDMRMCVMYVYVYVCVCNVCVYVM